SLALDFVNTVGNRLGESRDYLASISDVTRWARLAGLIPSRVTLSVKPSHLPVFTTVREELYETFRPIAAGSPGPRGALERLNQRLADVSQRRQITRGAKGFIWTWDTERSEPAFLLGPILLDAADLLTSGKFARIRQCEDKTCGWLFLDRSQA